MVAQHMEASPGIIEQRMHAQLGDEPEPMSPQVSQRTNAHRFLDCVARVSSIDRSILSVVAWAAGSSATSVAGLALPQDTVKH